MACDTTNGVCTAVNGMDQWLWFLWSRRQSKALAACALSHTGSVDVRELRVGGRKLAELRHPT